MMKEFTLSEIAEACSVHCAINQKFTGKICTDSRAVQPGDIFVALRGERFDGHHFLEEVSRAGAISAIVEETDEHCVLPQWQVPDSVLALGSVAAMNRQLFSCPVIGLTGSAGKTTTKEMIAAILAQKGAPLVTEGNLNNHLGVPLTLLRLMPCHDNAVIEMGASALGEIRYLTGLVRPDVALVTAVAPAHMEGFGCIENVAAGKAEIFEGLSATGTAVINLDNHYTASWLEELSQRFTVISYTVRSDLDQKLADVFATDVQVTSSGMRFVLHYGNDAALVSLGFLGRHNVGNAVAAAACCFAIGQSMSLVVSGLESASPYKGRLQLCKGISGATVIDDSYNANPASVRMAIQTLVAIDAEQKILVLGDMAELGEETKSLHYDIGAYAKAVGLNQLFACGDLSEQTVRGFGEGGCYFPSVESLSDACVSLANENTVYLVKGSRSAKMERVVGALIDGISAEQEPSGLLQVLHIGREA